MSICLEKSTLAAVIPVVLFCLSTSARAAIMTTGDITPVYNGIDDPWVVGSELRVGDTSDGSLVINNGSGVQTASLFYLGHAVGTSGVATVDGAGSALDLLSAIVVGQQGSGAVNIQAGASVTGGSMDIGALPGSTGEVLVTGAGSSFTQFTILAVGVSGAGELNIMDGATVSGFIATFGFHPGSSGMGTVSGSGSSFDVTVLNVVHGALEITNGGTVTSKSTPSINGTTGSGGTLRVDGVGSNFVSEDQLIVGSNGTGSVLIENGGHVTAYRVEVATSPGSSGLIRVSGTDSLLTVLGGALSLDHVGDGSLEILSGGTVISGTGEINPGVESESNVLVDGIGSTWTIGHTLNVGKNRAGTLRIDNGGKVRNAHGYVGNNSTVSVSGTSSWWENVYTASIGRGAQGKLNVEAGGKTSSHDVYIGEFTNSIGEVTVTGPDSLLLASGSLIVGKSGDGTLNVESGGIVDVAEDTIVAEKPWAAGEINFDGGVITTGNLWAASTALKGMGTINTKGLISDTDVVFDAVSGLQTQAVLNNEPGQSIVINLDVSDPAFNRVLGSGYGGTGTLTIEDGLTVNSVSGYLGLGSGSHGTTTVTGPGSMWSISDELHVGGNGIGRFIIENGGSVTSAMSYVGSLSNSNGSKSTASVTGAGSVWNVTTSLYVGGNQLSVNRPGEVTVGAGGLLDVSGAIEVFNAGSVLGGGTIHTTALSNRGSVKPGDGVGALALTGDYTQESNGSLHIDLAGSGGVLGVDSDVLIIDGDVNLDGALHLAFASGFIPNIGDTFEILRSTGTITGAFNSLVISGGNGLTLRTIYSLDSLVLVATLTGDLDEDGFVGISDLNLVLSHWNQVTTPGDWLAGDFNGDGFTGITDLNAVLGNWNAGTPPTSESGSTIPEPGTVLLMGVAGVGLCQRSSGGARG